MGQLPLILADAGPIIAVVFLILWGILSLMSVAKKQKRVPRPQNMEQDEEPIFEMELPLPPPPPPPPTLPRPKYERPKPVRRPAPPREESEWNQRPAPRPPRESRPRHERRQPAVPEAQVRFVTAQEPLLGEAVTASDIARSEIGGGPEHATPQRSERARRLARQLSPKGAREAIVLAEILAPPLALREKP